MNRFTTVAVSALTAVAAVAAQAEDKKPVAAPALSAEQQAQMAAFEKASTPGPEHEQLAYFVGSWTAKTQVWQDPKAPPEETTGTSKGAAIYGGRYVAITYDGNFMGQPFTGQGLFGFDKLRGKFLNTWTDSMSTSFWLAWGDYDKATNAWTFHGEMPDLMKPRTMVKVRQVIRIHDPNRYTFDWYETRGGKEAHTMNIDYRRQ